MKWGSLCALVVLMPLTVLSQDIASETVNITPERSKPAFHLTIDTPGEVREMLQRHLELERFRALPDLTESELSRLVLDAPKNIAELVATLGYFSPRIEVMLLPSGMASPVPTVAVQVDPGKPTRVVTVDLTLTDAASATPQALERRQEIADLWTLIPTMQFTQADWSNAKQKALRQLVSKGFPTGRIADSQADIDPQDYTAKLHVSLETGPVFRVGETKITGVHHYRSELITNVARIVRGEEFNQAELVRAQQRLLDSGYFDSAQVSLDVSENAQAAPIDIRVVEAPLQKVVLGIGASTDSGARLSATHTHHLVPGLEWRAVSKLSLDRDIQSIGSELTSQPDAANWQWAGSAQLQTEKLGSFDVTSQRLRGGRTQGGELTSQNYYLEYERAQASASGLADALVVQALSFNYAYTFRHFDNVPFPTSGWGLGLEVGGGSTFGVSHDPYGRVMVRGQAYLPLGSLPGNTAGSTAELARAGRLAFRAQMGAVVADDSASIPSTQLFVTGGDTSVRGYSRGAIGIGLPGTLVTAGRYLAVGSAEWQRPIVSKGILTDWESALFVDAGAVANAPHDMNPLFGVGVGLRWKSPVGPLQMDLASSVPWGHLQLHMNLGFSF